MEGISRLSPNGPLSFEFSFLPWRLGDGPRYLVSIVSREFVAFGYPQLFDRPLLETQTFFVTGINSGSPVDFMSPSCRLQTPILIPFPSRRCLERFQTRNYQTSYLIPNRLRVGKFYPNPVGLTAKKTL